MCIEKALPQCCGPKGYFKGSRKEFLKSYLQEYKMTKRGSHQNFWHKFYCAWWHHYPWRLNNDEEPPVDNPTRIANLAAVVPGEESQKKEVEKQLTEVCQSFLATHGSSDQLAFQHLTQWFVNHASGASESRCDFLTWLPLLQRLHQIQNCCLHCHMMIQQFMLDYSAEVNATFISQYTNGRSLTSVQRMNLHYNTAKFLLYN